MLERYLLISSSDAKVAPCYIANLSINTDKHSILIYILVLELHRQMVRSGILFQPLKSKQRHYPGLEIRGTANIVCYLHKISTREWLMFSNAYASLYVGNSQAEHPSINETLEFLKRFIQTILER